MSTFTTATSQQGIWDYVEKDQIDLVVAALKKDPKQLGYKQGHNEDTVLHVIAAKSDPAMLAAVIAVIEPDQLNLRNKNGATPLMSAGVNGREANAILLMEAKADVNLETQQGDTLISKTIKGRNQDDVRASEQPAFDRIIDAAVNNFGATVKRQDIEMADTFEDNRNMSFLETKMAQQKAVAVPGVSKISGITATASKLG